jgi:hypothetical protein|nr:MAG TPA: hypothetical protein [Caudoviricetes sp.]
MKRAALILAALAAILTAAAAPVRTATENFVANKIAEAVAAATNGFLRSEKDPLFTEWTNEETIVAGKYAESRSHSSIAFGPRTFADGLYSMAIGIGTHTHDIGSVAIGTAVVYDNGALLPLGAVSHGEGTFNIHATSPSLFYLGDRTLQSFLDAYAKPSVTNGLATKSEVDAKADKTCVYTKAEVDAKVDAVGNKADEAYSAAESLVDGVNSLAGTIGTHIRDTNNPHKVTAAQVGATTPADVTAAIREQSLGGIWDETLQVWWTPRMRNGSLTYEATTNVNLNAEN